MDSCVVCGGSLSGRRADARHCGGPCRAEASRLRRLLRGKEVGPYRSVNERLDVSKRANHKHEGNSQMKDDTQNEAAPNGEPQLDGDHDACRPDWIARGQAAINASVDPDEHETELVDLLCQLRHWAEAKGVSYDSANRRATWHYDHEKMRSRGPRSRIGPPTEKSGDR